MRDVNTLFIDLDGTLYDEEASIESGLMAAYYAINANFIDYSFETFKDQFELVSSIFKDYKPRLDNPKFPNLHRKLRFTAVLAYNTQFYLGGYDTLDEIARNLIRPYADDREYSIRIGNDDVAQYLNLDINRLLKTHFNKNETALEIGMSMAETYESSRLSNAISYSNAEELLSKFDRKKVVLITNSSEEVASTFLRQLGLRNYIGHIIVPESNDPDDKKGFKYIYERALKKVGSSANNVLFIDDSPKSLRGAELAGIRYREQFNPEIGFEPIMEKYGLA